MEDNRIKPDILSANTLLRRNLEASAPPDRKPELPLDVQRDIPGKNRHLEIRRDDDKLRDTTINLV